MNNCLVCVQDREVTEEELKKMFARGSYAYRKPNGDPLKRCINWLNLNDPLCKTCTTCQYWNIGYKFVKDEIGALITTQLIKQLHTNINSNPDSVIVSKDNRSKLTQFIRFVYNSIMEDEANESVVDDHEDETVNNDTQDIGTNTDNSLFECINIDSANIYNAPVYNAPVYNYSNQQEELEQKDEELEQERDKTANLTIQLEQERDKTANLTIQNNQKEEEINHLKEKNNHLTSQLEQKDNAINNLTIQNNQKEAEINHLKEKNNNLMQRLNKLPIIYGCMIVYLLVIMTIKIVV